MKGSDRKAEGKVNFVLGITEIDKMHSRLLHILKEMGGCIDAFSDVQAPKIRELIGEARDFAIQHFREEEALMVTVGYPMYRAHRAEHDHFFEHLEKALKIVENETIAKKDVKQFFDFLNDWFNSHITVTDRKYAEWIKSTVLQPR